MSSGPPNDKKAFSDAKLAVADLIRRDRELSGSTKTVGAEICSLTNFGTGYAWASEKSIAQIVGCSPRTVKMAIAALKAKGLILVEKIGRNNRYRPNFDLIGKGQSLPLFAAEKGQGLPLSEPDRGKNRHEQGQKTTENRGKKVPPISLENSLGISLAAAEAAAAGGAAPDGAAGQEGEHRFDLGLPGVALRRTLDETFRAWLGNVAVVSIGEDLVLSAPTKTAAQWIARNFESQVLACWRAQHPEVRILRMIVRTAVVPISQRDPDFLWLAQIGLGTVVSCAGITRDQALDRLEGWLKRCNQDAASVRGAIEKAATFDISGPRFITAVNEAVAAIHREQAPVLKFGPERVIRRSAS